MCARYRGRAEGPREGAMVSDLTRYPGPRRAWPVLAAVVIYASLGADAVAQASVTTDREALVVLYNATGGEAWTNSTNWKTGAPLREWYGVRTGAGGRVTTLDLFDNALTGSIPEELGSLSNLEVLSLTRNELTGSIPEALESLSNLEVLALGGNALTGPIPEELGSLSSLEVLYLSRNELTGPIPEELGSLSSLRELYLWGNELTGPIPEELGSLSRLEELYLSSNALTGPIPEELGSLSSLRELYLWGNELTGPIPEELGSLSNLEELYLSSNALTGPIPEELGSLSNLEVLSLSRNELTGPIPEELGSLSSLEELYLSSNALTGPIPEELGSLSNLEELSLSSNALTRPIPEELGSLSNLEELSLSRNELTGPIPEELGSLSSLRELYLWGNELTGPIPEELGSLSNLEELSLSSNALTGPIPEELGSLSNLEELSLSSNALTGPIPEELGSLSNLEELSLSRNELTGPVPEALGSLSNLRELYLYNNGLTGPVPDWLGNLSNLEVLSLSYNWGVSGELPDGLRLPHLRELDIGVTQACAPAGWRAWVRTIDFFGALCEVEADVTIDVAVVYTPAARKAAGGTAAIEAVIDLMIAETNQAYAASGVRHNMALVAWSEVPYAETGDSSIDLDRLRDPSDGHMDEVHALREASGADLVHLLFEEGDLGGIAYRGGPFGLSCRRCGGQVFAHETGHNMGLRHDRYQAHNDDEDKSLSSHPAYGYVNQRTFDAGAPPSSAWRTIMAYEKQCTDANKRCPRLSRFSNSRQTWQGDPLGVPFEVGVSGVDGPADAVAVLNTTGPAVALWRDRPATGTESFSIPNRGGQSITSGGTGETVRVGYGGIRAGAGSTTPSGIAIFQFRDSEGVLISEAGVPASEPVQEGRIFAEVNGPVNTGLAIANPNDGPATIRFYFTDTSGARFAEGSFELGAHRQTAKFLDEAPFNGGPSVLGTFTFTSSLPVAVVALRGFTNKAGEFLMTTLPVAPLSSTSSDTVYFPHFADGNGWATQVILVNPTDRTIAGTVAFLGQGSDTAAASPVVLTLDSGSTRSNFDYSIPPSSAQRFTTANPPGGLAVGSVRATPDRGNTAPAGLVVFSFAPGKKTLSEAGVPALPKGSAFRVYVEASGIAGQTGSIRSGLAIANTGVTSNTVTLEVTRLDGSLAVPPATLALPPSGQIARFIDEIFTLPDNFSGLLRVTSTGEVAMVGLRLRTNEKGEIKMTTTPPSNETGASTTADLFFPHLADSGGWSTQFILYSGTAGQAASGTLRFIDASGQPLDLPITQP